MRKAIVLGLGLCLVGAVAARADVQRLSYEIRKDGDPIGREDVQIDARPDLTVVDITSHSRATVLFMDFVFDHKRREEWRQGQLQSMVAETDDDGTKSRLDVHRDGSDWKISLNGAVVSQPAEAFPASLWTVKVVENAPLFGTIDAAPYKVKAIRVGDETITVMGQATPATHFRLEGDLERDLWYGADGTLLRTTFKRKGFPIEFVRVTR